MCLTLLCADRACAKPSRLRLSIIRHPRFHFRLPLVSSAIVKQWQCERRPPLNPRSPIAKRACMRTLGGDSIPIHHIPVMVFCLDVDALRRTWCTARARSVSVAYRYPQAGGANLLDLPTYPRSLYTLPCAPVVQTVSDGTRWPEICLTSHRAHHRSAPPVGTERPDAVQAGTCWISRVGRTR